MKYRGTDDDGFTEEFYRIFQELTPFYTPLEIRRARNTPNLFYKVIIILVPKPERKVQRKKKLIEQHPMNLATKILNKILANGI